ncbi:helix-turn-helix transcriptional regulator [Micromonospora sp. ANENR4]|uniref:PadR family transcriptional regulator n=1 Tax=unclassified Micromonospora TaxID=2617518 RepID=UPI00188FE93F|nr:MULTISPECIES: PadR family transcriptional regulator [unclassified Micromonospora]MBF5030780.1 helix-turn-helix transcriptional regulator [Micromonospora sp. ANENR4]MCZ7474145.1 PadR family transcriptional regulator [Micromonospora sp. WMMC273]
MGSASRPALREPSYFVLAALLGGPLHGYAVIKRVTELSGGRVTLAAGSLYSVIDRLLGEGLVIADGEEIVNGRARRYYRLTDEGCRVLTDEADRLAQAARVVMDRLPGRVASQAGARQPSTVRIRPA